MAIQTKRIPRAVAIGGSRIASDKEAVEFLVRGADGEDYTLALDRQILASLVTAILAHSKDLTANLPDMPTQAMKVREFQIAMNPAGALGWKIELAGGLALVLEFAPDQFDALDARMNEVRALSRRSIQ